MPQPQATHWPRVLLLWLCGVLAAMQFAKISVAFQALQALYAASPAQMGLVLSTVGLVGLLLGVTVGLFAPPVGYRRLLLAGLGTGALISAVQSLLPPFPLFFATRVLEGVSHLAVVVAAPTLLMAQCAPGHRSVAMGIWSTFVGVAFALAAVLGHALIARTGVASLLQGHAVALALMFWLARLALPPDPAGRPKPAWPRTSQLLAQHVQTYARLTTALPGLCFLCYTLMGVALLTFVPPFAGSDALWLAALLPLAVTAGTFCAGWMAQHWLSPLLLARAAFACVALCAAALWLCHRGGVSIAPAALLLLLSSGLCGGSGYALIPFLNKDSDAQARANGAVAQLGNLGSTSGPPLFAASSAAYGMTGLLIPTLACAAVGFLLSAWAARQLR